MHQPGLHVFLIATFNILSLLPIDTVATQDLHIICVNICFRCKLYIRVPKYIFYILTPCMSYLDTSS